MTDIISASSREKPADAVLRAELKSREELTPEQRREISRAVFTYYRWKEWLKNEKAVESRLGLALQLAERFRNNPFSLPADALRSKAVPAWVAGEVDMSDAWLRSLLREPRLWLRARAGQGKALARKLGNAKPHPLLPDAIEYLGAKDLFLTPEFQAGEFEIQDIASQAVSLLCAPKPGETWWDACAGEGGKTLHLTELMQNKGLIWATDRAEWRLEKLKARASRAQMFNYRSRVWDGGETPPTETSFDGVLVDAPCSGLGTWARNPHAKWTTRLEDVKELAAAQGRLLCHAARSLKPGGRLVYAVCTLTRSETVNIANEFERAFPDFEPAAAPNPFAPETAAAARHWFWPQTTGGNGMFVAVWKRLPAARPVMAAG